MLKFLSEWEVLINLSLMILLVILSWVGMTHELRKVKNAVCRVLNFGSGMEDMMIHIKWVLLYLSLSIMGGVAFLVYAFH